jgi:hypothetical protein
MMKAKHIRIFLIWLIVLNMPALFVSTGIGFFRLLFFLPYLFWINIPGLWLGLAKAIGQPHYDIEAFGALPQTPLAWGLILIFWIVVAVAITALTIRFPKLIYYKRKDGHPTKV